MFDGVGKESDLAAIANLKNASERREKVFLRNLFEHLLSSNVWKLAPLSG
jgi:hypothetical protein